MPTPGKVVDSLPPAYFLAISGGGDAGAFGAGLLLGWTDLGTRPRFNVVAGASAGGLIAPFAFLGPRYDPALRHVFTCVDPEGVREARGVHAALTGDCMADHLPPLWNVIAKYVTSEFLTEVAAEYAKGRFLLVSATNVDAHHLVIWNMGAIASNKDPRALKLFRDIMFSSAVGPRAVASVRVDIEVDEFLVQEDHLNGDAIARVFLHPPGSSGTAVATGGQLAERGRYAYVIRNSVMGAEWAVADGRATTIAGHSIASLLQKQGIEDVYRIFAATEKEGVDFNLAFIGPDLREGGKEGFDTGSMRNLFDYGYRLSSKGYPWQKAPPGVWPP